ncbi:hypothetical protein AgCh_031376 [Apium graveolens]
MRNNDQNQRGGRNNSVIHNSFRTFSTYFKAVSNGASTVVKSAASVASSAIADRDNDTTNDQINWAGFDKLEFKGNAARRVLLLGYRFGFQVWDVEEANNVRELISRYDGPVSFMQILPKLEASKQFVDKFEDSRPLLALCADGSFSGGIHEGAAGPCNGNIQNCYDQFSGGFLPTVVWFYSLTSQSYVQMLKFRSVVYSVRCSPRVVIVLQAAQIHCFDAATLEKEYNILTNPIATNGFINGAIGLGPLAVGPRWMAYSGPPVAISNCGRVDPQHLTPSASSPSSSSGSLVAHYAKESSKQLAAGIVTLGDKSYKKISRYYSELLPDSNSAQKTGNPGSKHWGTDNGHLPDAENIGMVIVRDVLSKSVIAQFRAHKSPISLLSFDPSGTLLVTASVQGHNINVYKITPDPSGSSSGCDSSAAYVHLYRLQRGLTNAVIADVSFSDDSNWIMISSSRGTGHLFAISPSGGKVNFPYSHSCFTTKTIGAGAMMKPSGRAGATSSLQVLNQQKLCDYGPPVALSPVSRVRSSNNGWRSAVTGAAATATGRMGTFCGIITSVFHYCKENDLSMDSSHWKPKYDLLVFSPSGCVIQYALRMSSGLVGVAGVSGISTTYDQTNESDPRLIVEAIQKWNICQKQNRRERENNSDIYGENGCSDGSKIYPEEMSKEKVVLPEVKDAKVRISSEDRYHMYISEAELHMHLPQAPLWARSEIYFQTMIKDDSVLGEEDTLGGEIQIETFPARMVEARLKDLVPVFDYHKMPHFQMARGPSNDNNGQLSHESSGSAYSEDDITKKTSSSLDSTDGTSDEHPNGTENIVSDGLWSEGFVNNRASPKVSAQLEFVNNRDSSVKNRKQNFVDNHIEDQKMGNQFGDEGYEFEVRS